jgi:hypothetical protein
MVRLLPAATLLAFTVSVVALAKTAPPAQPFQRIDGCVYKPQRWNDGDSFHVILPNQKELAMTLSELTKESWQRQQQKQKAETR